MQEVLGLIIVLVVVLVILNGVARTPPTESHKDPASEYATAREHSKNNRSNQQTETQYRILEMLHEIPIWYYFDEELRDVRYLEFSVGAPASGPPVAIKFRAFDTFESGSGDQVATDEDFKKAQNKQALEPKMWNWGPEPGTITILLDGGMEAHDPRPATVVAARGKHVLVLSFQTDYLLEFFEYESGHLIKNEKLQPHEFS